MKRIVQVRCRPAATPSRRFLAAVLGSLLLGTAGAQLGGMKRTERVSISSNGTPGDQDSEFPSISADGQYVAFASYADNLVPDDTNGAEDVFVRDRTTGKTELVSLSSRDRGAAGNRNSEKSSISPDGRYVAFASEAGNLVGEDTNGKWNIFVRDRAEGKTELVSLSQDGAPVGSNDGDTAAISRDGHYVAFASYSNFVVPGDTLGNTDVFVRDRMAMKTEIVSVRPNGSFADGSSFDPAISENGQYVAFTSQARDLVPGDRNNVWDVFVRDRVAGTTELISCATDGTQGDGQSQGPAISADGRYVAFLSFAGNLVPGDRNDYPDIFVRDRTARMTVRVSFVAPGDAGNEYNWGQASISGDGSKVAFVYPTVASGDTKGRWHIFVRDWIASAPAELITVSEAGTPGNGTSLYPAMSPNGRFVAFESTADNLVPGDTNGHRDIFVRELSPRPAGLVAEPASLTFGRIAVGTTTMETLRLRNDGTRRLTGTVGALAPPFMVVEGGGSFSLGPGDSRRVTVSFAPTRLSDPGGFQARLAITSDDPSTPTLAVLVSGESFSAADGRLVLSPTPRQGLTLVLTARDLVYGECKERSLMLQNRGLGSLTGHVEGLPLPFAVVEGVGDFALEPGQSKRVTVRFCAPVGGLPARYQTTLGIDSSDPVAPHADVPVRAEPP